VLSKYPLCLRTFLIVLCNPFSLFQDFPKIMKLSLEINIVRNRINKVMFF
jgi:hypothetical protein